MKINLLISFFSFSIVLLVLTGALDFNVMAAHAQSATPSKSKEEIQNRIDQKNKEIADLENEINGFKVEIQKTTGQAKTLEGELSRLELNRKKLTADITLTAKKIDAATLTIESLGEQIGNKELAIGVQQDGLRSTLKQTNEIDNRSIVEIFLDENTLSQVWDTQNTLLELRDSMRVKAKLLLNIKNDLTVTKTMTEKKQQELVSLQFQLADQKKIVEANKKQTDALLKDTKNKESNYKKLLADRETKRLAFEKELNNYEAELKLIIDPGSYPNPKSILQPPLAEMFVTQQFGDTAFSRQNPGVYSGKGHNAIDLKASPGTPVKAALSGVVQIAGDTDLVCPGASYGRFVFIKHDNGLSTIYAHFSLIKVAEGQRVETGQLIGYSGNTGYSTGPHLHFGVYVSQGVQVANLKSKVCKGTYRIPVADLRAYLNPMLYL